MPAGLGAQAGACTRTIPPAPVGVVLMTGSFSVLRNALKPCIIEHGHSDGVPAGSTIGAIPFASRPQPAHAVSSHWPALHPRSDQNVRTSRPVADRHRMRLTRARICVASIVIAALACQPVEVAPIHTGLPRTEEVRTLVADGFQIDYPLSAIVDTLAPADDALLSLRIRGPHITVGLPNRTESWNGPAYDLEVLRYPNPQALSAEAWLRDRMYRQDGEHVQNSSPTRVSGRQSIRVAAFAGADVRIITVYVPRDRQMVALRYFEFPLENHPGAPAADAVHTMMVGTFRYIEQ